MDNGLLDFILSLTADHQIVVVAGGVILLLLLYLWRNRQAQRLAARRPRARPSVLRAEVAEAPQAEFGPRTIMEPPSKGAIEVMDVDPMAEVAVYMEFGYFEQAAQTLRWYVDGGGRGNLDALRKLLQIYHRLSRIDDYADILERLCDAGQDPGYVRESVLAGLAADRENLPLRVLAESRLGLGPEQLDELLGPEEGALEVVAEAAPPPPPAPEVHPGAPAAPRPIPPVPREGAAKAAAPTLRLVEGKTPLKPLSAEERAVLSIFANPAHEARLHLAVRDLDAAVPALRRAIAAQPGNLAGFTELLKIFYTRRQIQEYADTLWHLYSVLNGAGRSLRERLLGMGFALGDHPLLEALAQAKDARQVEAVGREFGLVPVEVTSGRKFKLVDVAQQGAPIPPLEAEEGGDVLKEVDVYLEFGQTEQALDSLEAAVIQNPMDARLYPPLLDLYDRMDDLPRFTALTSRIKKLVQRPPEEVVPMMLNLYQRLEHRKQETAA
jgi:tetratricopeptide (TPR) repeat protein